MGKKYEEPSLTELQLDVTDIVRTSSLDFTYEGENDGGWTSKGN